MKNRRIMIVFACVAAAHILVVVGIYFFANLKPAAPKDAAEYMEIANFQYDGGQVGGDEAPKSEPSALEKHESVPQNEIVDPALPQDSNAAPAESAPSDSSDVSPSGAGGSGAVGGSGDGDNPDYMPMQKISQLPVIPEQYLRSKLEYPEMARRSGIMGRVFLELFVDAKGRIRKIEVLKEDPTGYGFASAAVSALGDCPCVPAKVNGEAVAVRFRYPIRFSLN